MEGTAGLQIIVFNHRALETQPFGAWRLSLATSSCNAKLLVEHNEDILRMRGEKKHCISSHGREHKLICNPNRYILSGEMNSCISSSIKMNLPEILRQPCSPADYILRLFSSL